MNENKRKQLHELYRKIKDGVATEEETMMFEMEKATNCLKEDEFIKIVSSDGQEK